MCVCFMPLVNLNQPSFTYTRNFREGKKQQFWGGELGTRKLNLQASNICRDAHKLTIKYFQFCYLFEIRILKSAGNSFKCVNF